MFWAARISPGSYYKEPFLFASRRTERAVER